MSWREKFLMIGPGLLAGCTFGQLWRLLRAARFRFEPRRLPNVVSSLLISTGNSFGGAIDAWRFGRQVRETQVPAPLFILGHWRSGTTHLHNLFAADRRFAYPNLYQVLYPHSFLSTEAVASPAMAPFLPKTRVRVDNMRMTWQVPYEDEFALAVASGLSSYMSLLFTERREHYDRYLTLRSVSPEEVDAWKRTLMHFLRKLTVKYQRPLVIKSPPHTCRIRLLLEMFPDAKFVHIHRHPHAVFRSTRKMIQGAHDFWGLQRKIDWDDRIVRQYREMYDVFFDEKELIPEGQFHELAFDDLERDPVGTLRAVYQSLALPDFGELESDLKEYLASIGSYQRNEFAPLEDSERKVLAEQWSRSFETWGYET